MLSALFLFSILAQPSDALAAKAQEARSLMAAGRFDDAIPLYRDLVKAMPGTPGLALNLGLAQHMAGRDREAVANFELVLRLQPRTMPALMSLAEARLALGEPVLAVVPLQRAAAIEPESVDVRGMLATALMGAKRYVEAAAQYRWLSGKSPEDPRAWYGLGMAYQSLSTEAFERMQKLDAKSPWVSSLVADTRAQRGQYRSAFFFYNEALKGLPRLHGLHGGMAEIYRKTGHPEWAAIEDAKERELTVADCAAHPFECKFAGGKNLDILSAKTPDSLESLYWRTKAGNELATQAFFRLGQLPESLELHQFRADVARDAGRPREAVEEWRAALQLVPGDVRARQELAVSLFTASDYRAAFDEASALLKTKFSAELAFVAGDSLLRLEDAAGAEQLLRAALKADAHMVAAGASLGLALSRLERFKEAVPLLEKSLELDEDGSLHYQLARAYQSAGLADKARVTMGKYQELVERNQRAKDEVAGEAQIGPPK